MRKIHSMREDRLKYFKFERNISPKEFTIIVHNLAFYWKENLTMHTNDQNILLNTFSTNKKAFNKIFSKELYNSSY